MAAATPSTVLAIFIMMCCYVEFNESCEFPSFMQTKLSGRDWRGSIRNQNTEFTLRINVTGNKIKTISTDNTEKSHDRVCLQVLDGDKFLVAHEETGQSSSHYTCVQFVKRSNSVVQIREAALGTTISSDLCNDLQLNQWLIIDQNNVSQDAQLCPLVGGFSIQIFDKKRGKGVCDGFVGQTRIESECAQGEGFFFYFRTMRCVPSDLFMYDTQQTLCLASWQEASYIFVLLKHNYMNFKYMWVLRYPASQGNNFIASLMLDLVADTRRQIEASENYLRLDMVRDTPRPVHALCLDDYQMCTGYKTRECSDPETALLCPRTCGLCDVSKPMVCNFPNKFQTQWYNAAEPAILAMNVNQTVLTVYNQHRHIDLHCIRWDREPATQDQYLTKQMLVKESFNGCRPRYTCAEFMQNSPTVLLVKLSLERTWPFTNSPDDPVDCRHFTYEDDSSLTPMLFKTKYLNLVYLRASNTQQCDIPFTIHSYKVTFYNGVECSVTLNVNRAGTGFELDMPNCPTTDIPTQFMCVDSSKMLPRRDQLVVTRSLTNADLIHCWFFPKRQEDIFYLLKAQDCNEAIRKRLNKEKLPSLAVFVNPEAKTVAKETASVNTVPFTEDTPDTPPTLEEEVPHTELGKPPKYNGPDTTDWVQNDDPKLWGNDTDITYSDDEGSTKVTAVSLLVVGTVLSFAVIQTFCICKS